MDERNSVGASPDGDRATHERGQSSVSPPSVGIPSAARLSASIWSGHFTKREGDPARCRASVPDGGRSPMFHQCTRKPTVFRDCTSPAGTFGFCKMHDPVAEAERRAAKDAKWRREWDERDARLNLREKRVKAEKRCIAVLREIAAGHNDPRSIAQEALAALDAIAMEARQGGDGETRPHPKDDSAGRQASHKGSSHG